jgi:predicted TPR repeat methyltransferase
MSDALAVALEHHRAGRLRQAAGDYRAILEKDPKNADALHWLGVLAFQAGRPDHSIPLFERAIKLRPTDPAFHHNLAMAHLHAGDPTQAIHCFEHAADLAPGRADTQFALGLAHMVRNHPGDAHAATFAFRQAHLAGLDTAQLHQYAGIAHLAAHRPEDAVASFKLALKKDDNDPTTYHHLALAYRQIGEVKEVRKNLNKALELDPTHARAWYALAILDAEEGNPDIAVSLFKKAIKFKPDFPAAHHGLGRVLEQTGRRADATRAYAQALRASRETRVPAARVAYHDPDPLKTLEEKVTDSKILELHHALAANAPIFSPTKVPTNAIANLFDRYAETFDDHLRTQLKYGVPELIAQSIAPFRNDEDAPWDILDLGCGTGLIAPLLKPIAKSLHGVDLSPAILEKAKARNLYDKLEQADMVQTLQNNPQSYDLLTAADSLIYTGDLTPIFQAAHAALRKDGPALFAFSVEAGETDRYHLHQKTLRYTHSEKYLKHLAKIHGFAVEHFALTTLRFESEKPVSGYLVVLRAIQP